MTGSLIAAGTVLAVAFLIAGTVVILVVIALGHYERMQEERHAQERELASIAATVARTAAPVTTMRRIPRQRTQ